MSGTIERGSPTNTDAERFVLAQIMLDGCRSSEIASSVDRQDFAVKKHRRIRSMGHPLSDPRSPVGRIKFLAREELESCNNERGGEGSCATPFARATKRGAQATVRSLAIQQS